MRSKGSRMPFQNGSLRLFRFLGVTVFVHWSWALVAALQIWWRSRPPAPGAPPEYPLYFHAALYLCLFAIVLLHEYGHALACKSVGGKAERIVLWPLGGLAFVQPPPRPGALLWSIAAGPLVNVILLPLTLIPAFLMGLMSMRWGDTGMGTAFIVSLAVMNLAILVFNLLPFYPLDGGQILRALLWFVCGPGLSLVIAACVGIVGSAFLAILAFMAGGIFLAVIVAFMGLQCFAALRVGRGMMQLEKSPRRPEVRCPACGVHPPIGAFWNCPCGARLDTFETGGQCPRCGRAFEKTACAACGQLNPLANWYPMPEEVFHPTGGAPQPAPGMVGEGPWVTQMPPPTPPSSWR